MCTHDEIPLQKGTDCGKGGRVTQHRKDPSPRFHAHSLALPSHMLQSPGAVNW